MADADITAEWRQLVVKMIEQLGERIERVEDTMHGYTERLTAAGLQISDRMSAIERSQQEIRRDASEARETAGRIERTFARDRSAQVTGQWQLWTAMVSGLIALAGVFGVAAIQIWG